MDERQRDAGIDEQAPETERADDVARPERDEAEADRTWGADDSLGDAESPGT